jgi:hypothetical protein
MLKKRLSSTTWKFFENCPNTSKKSHAHLQCVHNNCARLEECQLKGVGGVDYTLYCRLFKTCWKNDKFNYMEIFRQMFKYFQKLSHMHIFNPSITTVQGLKNVSLKVWEEMITQSRGSLFKTCWKNDQVQLHGNFSKNVQIFPKSHMHIFNVSITTMQGLKNIS